MTKASETTALPPWARRAILSLLIGIASLWYLRGVVSALRPLLMVLLVSLFLSFALEPAVNRLQRHGMRRGPGTFLVLAVMVAAIGGFGVQVGSLLAEQVTDFSENVPTYLEEIDGWLDDSFGIEHQRHVLEVWDLAIEKTGGYILSRSLLALASSLVHWAAFEAIGLPSSLALALWVGVMSQFVPVVGTYIAGALPLVIALLGDPVDALWVMAAVAAYQQVENYVLAPRITAHTMQLHVAVAFGAVIAGSAVLGVVGALLALPAAATIQSVIAAEAERHEVAEHLIAESSLRRRQGERPPSD